MGVRSCILKVGPSPLRSHFEAGPGKGPPRNPRLGALLNEKAQPACPRQGLRAGLWGLCGRPPPRASSPLQSLHLAHSQAQKARLPRPDCPVLAGLGEASPRRRLGARPPRMNLAGPQAMRREAQAQGQKAQDTDAEQSVPTGG